MTLSLMRSPAPQYLFTVSLDHHDKMSILAIRFINIDSLILIL